MDLFDYAEQQIASDREQVNRTIPPIAEPKGLTIAEERARLEQVRQDHTQGTTCGACGQYVRTYRWKFHSALARGMIALVKEHLRTDTWVHVPTLEGKVLRGTRCLTRAALWGLIEPQPEDDDEKKTSGMWKPTKNGQMFVYNQLTIPSHVFVSDDTVRGFDETRLVGVKEVLGSKFDYNELMLGR